MSKQTPAPVLAALQESFYIADGVREKDCVRHTVFRAGYERIEKSFSAPIG